MSTIPVSQARVAVANRFLVTQDTQKSMIFNGSTSVAKLPTAFNVESAGFNIAFWAYINSAQSNYVNIITEYDAGPTNGFSMNKEFNGGLNRGIYVDFFNNTSTVSGPTMKAPFDKWFHLVFTFSSGTAKLYLNTELKSTVNSIIMTNPTLALAIARLSQGAAGHCKENIANFTILKSPTPWTQNEIESIYWRNMIPFGATQWSMNNVDTDQNGLNPLTLTSIAYSTNVPSHFTARNLAGERLTV